MKKRNLLFVLGLALCSPFFLLLQNCATIIESKCELSQFEGTYIGFYRIADLIDVADTVVIEVDLEANEATITSAQLDTFFITKFLTQKNELTINPIVIDVFQVGELTFTNASIQKGFARLDGECNNLFLEMSGISVNHNFTGLPNPLRNVKLDTPEFLTRQ